MIHTNLQCLSPGPGLERQTFLYPNTNKCLQMTEIFLKKSKTKPQQQKTSNVSFLPLNVYTVILFSHRNLLLRPANSCPCAVHNKQDGILGCCSNSYVSIKVCASKHSFLTDPRFLEYLCLSLIQYNYPFFITFSQIQSQACWLASNLTQLRILRTIIMMALTSHAHCCNRNMGVMGVTDHLLIEWKAHCTQCNPYLGLLIGPKI